MNVYSIVPSQRSQATVSVMNSIQGRQSRPLRSWPAPSSLRGSCKHLPVLVVLVELRLELTARGREERLLERLDAEALEDLGHGLEEEQLAPVEDADSVRQRLRLGEVVRAEEDRR